MAQAYAALTSQVHPLALGNILRNHNLIRHLARRLLLMHMDAEADKDQLESIVRKLTEELYAHDYTITRDEAHGMGLKVTKPSDQVEIDLWEIFKLYGAFLGWIARSTLALNWVLKSRSICVLTSLSWRARGLTSFCIRGTGYKGSERFGVQRKANCGRIRREMSMKIVYQNVTVSGLIVKTVRTLAFRDSGDGIIRIGASNWRAVGCCRS